MNKERELLKLCAEAFALHNKCPNLTGDINELLAQPERTLLIEKHDTFLRSLIENNGEGLKELKAFDLETYNKLKEVFGMSDLPAQPEQAEPEQEPMAWVYCWDDEHERTYVNLLTTDTEHKHLKTAFNVMPLYASPPKREPLSEAFRAGISYSAKKYRHATVARERFTGNDVALFLEMEACEVSDAEIINAIEMGLRVKHHKIGGEE